MPLTRVTERRVMMPTACFVVDEPMTLVRGGIPVGDALLDPIEITVTKRDYKWTKED